MSFHLSDTSKQRMTGIDIRLVDIAERAIQITRIDFGIPEHGGKRTAEEQNKLYLEKASNADGYTNKSYHQTGKALDFYAYVEGKATWDMVYMAQVACAFLQAANELGFVVEWGGLWKNFVDTPHIQLKG
jgi:peptidoglycan LD-endopeptidase CwlK